MKKFEVSVTVTHFEIYEVEAECADDARELYATDGFLIYTDTEPDFEVTEITEVPESPS